MHFKDSLNNLHELSEEDIANGGTTLLPDDCVEITDGEAEAIRISKLPVVEPQRIIKAKLDAVRELRERTINRVNGIADRLARKGNTTIRAVGDDVVQALLDVTKNPPTDPALVDAAMMARYAAIVAPLVASNSPLLNAFAEMDQ